MHQRITGIPKIQVRSKSMACCGQRRQQMRSQAIPVLQANNAAKAAGFAESPVRQQITAFQYLGKTALTAVGPVSGRHYRFSQPERSSKWIFDTEERSQLCQTCVI